VCRTLAYRASIHPMPTRKELLRIGDREVSISNPDKVYFPRAGLYMMFVVLF
jgi:hypothetical protein